jgi:hypothetical protein
MWDRDRPRTVRTEIISVDTDRLACHAFAKSQFGYISTVQMADGKTLLTVGAAADWDGKPGYYWFRNQRDANRVIDTIVEGLESLLRRRLAHARRDVDAARSKSDSLFEDFATLEIPSAAKAAMIEEATAATIEECARWEDRLAALTATPYVATRTEGGVQVEAADIDAVIEECRRWCAVDPLTGKEIDAYIAEIKKDMDRALVQWQVTGHMKRLNAEYKALRLGRAPGEKIPSFKNWLTAQFEAHMLQPVPSSPV